MNPETPQNDSTGETPPESHPMPPEQQTYQPLGAPQPGQGSSDQQPQIVYMSRPLEPHRQPISADIKQKHDESVKRYPKLNISEGEYIISAIKRHPIGLLTIWLVTGAALIAIIAILVVAVSSADADGFLPGTTMPVIYLAIPALLLCILALIFAFVGTTVYNANRFFLTNESVIQHIQTSLFSQREQTISLANIEDASFTQDGIVPHLFNYGMLRLSTQGDETTYRFTYASNPQKQIALLNNAVEDFKNVRPIERGQEA